MRFRPGSVIRLEHDLDGIDAGDFAVISFVWPWIRLGRLAEDDDGQLIGGPIVAELHANALSEYARPLNIEAEVEGA